MFFGLIIGIAIGFVFKPQLEIVLRKILKTAKKNINTEEE